MHVGAISGDIVGSVYEWNNVKRKDFGPLFRDDSFFTDDTVHTVAVMSALMRGGKEADFAKALRDYTLDYPGRGYGRMLQGWAHKPDSGPYGSYGNGSAMRASPCGWWAISADEARALAAASAAPTHNHPEGVKGAQAVAVAIWLARKMGNSREARREIRRLLEREFGYDLRRTADEIRRTYEFDETCQGTVPEALVCALGAEGFEDAIRTAISIGGDSDTVAAIAGGVAEALWTVPKEIWHEAHRRMDELLSEVASSFTQRAKRRNEDAGRPPHRSIWETLGETMAAEGWTPTPPRPGRVEEGRQALERAEALEAEARKLYERAGSLGQAEATYQASLMMKEGRGGMRAPGYADRYMVKAAEQGHGKAQIWFAQRAGVTHQGDPRGKEEPNGLKILRRIARDAELAEDREKARKLVEQADKRHQAWPELNRKEEQEKQEKEEARRKEEAEVGRDPAKCMERALAAEGRIGNARGEDRVRAANEAGKWCLQAAKLGNAAAGWKLVAPYGYTDGRKGVMFRYRHTEERERVVTELGGEVALTRAAAEASVKEAQEDLADRLKVGKGVPRDVEEAAKWYRRAGNTYEVACLYESDEDGIGDKSRAFELFCRLAREGNIDAKRKVRDNRPDLAVEGEVDEEFFAKHNRLPSEEEWLDDYCWDLEQGEDETDEEFQERRVGWAVEMGEMPSRFGEQGEERNE